MSQSPLQCIHHDLSIGGDRVRHDAKLECVAQVGQLVNLVNQLLTSAVAPRDGDPVKVRFEGGTSVAG